MKIAIVAAVLVSSALTATAYADVPGKGWLSQARVSHILERKGYHVTKIEADDGHWEGDAVRRGTRYEFHVDPHSGRITKMERDHH